MKVLFVCLENSCRSQMAEGFLRACGADLFEASSAGSNPSGEVNPMAVKVMREEGIDISPQKSKGFKDLDVKEADLVVSMGCGDICPFFPDSKHIRWDIENPRGQDITVFRRVRDEIKEKVLELKGEHGKTF
jgi:arsenate reductase